MVVIEHDLRTEMSLENDNDRVAAEKVCFRDELIENNARRRINNPSDTTLTNREIIDYLINNDLQFLSSILSGQYGIFKSPEMRKIIDEKRNFIKARDRGDSL